MRVVLSALLCLISAPLHAEVWEKLIRPGLTYRMEMDLSIPRVVHALKLHRGSSGAEARAEVAGEKIFLADPSNGRQTLSEMVRAKGAIGGINGDFFPYTGDPVGAMVRAGEMLSRPYKSRAVLAWGRGGSQIASLSWNARLHSAAMQPITVTGLNEACGPDTLVLNTDSAGFAKATPPCVYVVVKFQDPVTWSPNCRHRGYVASVVVDIESLPVEPGSAVLAATGSKARALANLARGDDLTISMATQGLDFSKYDYVIGGGPNLIRGGQLAIDWEASEFKSSFALNRHPRTAVGRTLEGDLWFVVVDGRQEISAGATLEEMARIMARLGCVDAMNVDGGGSTSFNLFGLTVNRPSEGAERPICNAILFFGDAPVANPTMMVIQGPATMTVGSTATYRVIGPDGRPLADRDVIWTSQGAAWVDQGGMARALRPGACTLTAWAQGQPVTMSVTIQAPG